MSSNVQFIFLRVNPVELVRNLNWHHSLYHLGNPSIEGTTFVGIGEVLTVEDLNLPVLLDER